MTTNKPNALPIWIAEEAWADDVMVVRLSDYEALQADRDQQYDMKIKAREQRDFVTAKMNTLQAELQKLKSELATVKKIAYGNIELMRENKTLQAERDSYKNTITEVTTRHFAERWSKTTADKELEQYLSDGIAQLEAEHRKQIEALQAELEKWERGSEIRSEQNRDLFSIVFELKAECEKLRKDAARYQWLRDSCIDNSESAYIGVWHEESGRYVDTFIDREALYSAIDTAMQLAPVVKQ